MEINKRKCKICLEKKDRLFAGKFPKGELKRWRDEDNLLWSGNVCGKCNVNRSKMVMRNARKKFKKPV